MSDPKVIYLGPICVEGDDERTWCDRDVWEHSDCEVEGVCTDPVKYIRADVVAELEKENKKAFKAGYEAGMLIMESPQGWDTWQQAYDLWKKRGEIAPAFSG